MIYNAENLLITPTRQKTTTEPAGGKIIVSLTPETAGWDLISFQVRKLSAGMSFTFQTQQNELALISLSGEFSVKSNRGEWEKVGGRPNVFADKAHALYLPRQTTFEVVATNDCELAMTWVPTDQDHQAWLIRPEEVKVSIRGGANVTRQINDLLPPGSPVHRLVLVEVYTPSGNWSSYPPHKHDRILKDEQGKLLEVDLEEIYFYKIDRPEGYALQHVYTDETSKLHKNGQPIDALICARDNSVVLVPEGYHPVVSAPGYTTYYLNVLAGSHQSLAAFDDPRYSWVKDEFSQPDSRVPLY